MVQTIKDSWNEFKSQDLITKLICVWLVTIVVSGIVGIFNAIFSD